MRRAVLLLGLIVLFLSDFVFSQDTVYVSLPHLNAKENDFVNLSVQISDLTGLNVTSIQFTLFFADSVLRAQGVSVGGAIMQSWGQPTVSISDSGSITVGAFGLTPLSGSGKLINILFEAIGQVADSSLLIMKPFTFNDGNPIAISDTGTVHITQMQLVSVIVSTNYPAVVPVIVDGEEVSTPFYSEWDMFTEHSLGVIDTFIVAPSDTFKFDKWSDGGDKLHNVTILRDTIFTAFFIYTHPNAVSKADKRIFGDFALYQNYPNPFNPTTTIRYTIPSITEVTINVYNLSGQLVRNLFSGRADMGHYDLVFDGKDDMGRYLPSGIYWYELKTAEFRQVNKLIFMK